MVCNGNNGNVAICSSTTLIGSIEIPNVAVIEETFAVNNLVPNGFCAFDDDDEIIVPRRRKIALGFSFESLIIIIIIKKKKRIKRVSNYKHFC